MTPAEVARVLAKAAAFDQRTIGEADVAAWHEIVAKVELADGLAAVTRHYTETGARIMPADLLRHARAAREDRRRREVGRQAVPALALPSRYEPDMIRDLQIERGAAQCREVLGPIMARLQQHRLRVAQGKTITEETRL
jgi:hypothetical protein